jgi:putative oxidoreductase
MATTSTSPVAANGPIVFLGRFLFALIFVLSGPRHFMASTIAYAAAQGAPLASIAVPFSGLLALLGGLSILLGFRAKIGAWMIALFLVGVTPVMHRFWGIADPMMAQMQMIHFIEERLHAGRSPAHHTVRLRPLELGLAAKILDVI